LAVEAIGNLAERELRPVPLSGPLATGGAIAIRLG
jgi:hypothetical protein